MKNRRDRFRNNIDKESQQMIDEKMDSEKEILKEVEDIINEVLTNKKYIVDYDECNNRTFMRVKVDDLDNGTLLKIKNKIDNSKYHIENKKLNKSTIIEVHFKSAF